MKYKDIYKLPVLEIPRIEIETCFSFGNYDGVGIGLVRWENNYWYAHRMHVYDDRYWVVELTKEQQDYANWYGKEWAKLFSSNMSYNPDGSCVPQTDGIYAIRTPSGLVFKQPFYSDFSKQHPEPKPSEDAEVVGYFYDWSL